MTVDLIEILLVSLDVSSGILHPLMQLPMTDCSCVMFASYVTINTICLESLFEEICVSSFRVKQLLF